jgi:hypothetical protein
LGWSTKRRRVGCRHRNWRRYSSWHVGTVADRNPVGQHGHTSGTYRYPTGKYCNPTREHRHTLRKCHQSICSRLNVSEFDVPRLDIDWFLID